MTENCLEEQLAQVFLVLDMEEHWHAATAHTTQTDALHQAEEAEAYYVSRAKKPAGTDMLQNAITSGEMENAQTALLTAQDTLILAII